MCKIQLPLHQCQHFRVLPDQHLGVLVNSMSNIVCHSLSRGEFFHRQNWAILTQDNWVLQTVQGYLIDFTQSPHQSYQPPPKVLPQDKYALVTREVQELLLKGAVVESSTCTESFVSQIFLVKKKGGGQRPVINLKALNQFVQVEHFKMEDLHLLPDLLQQGDWMIKMDLKDAYFQISIHPSH